MSESVTKVVGRNLRVVAAGLSLLATDVQAGPLTALTNKLAGAMSGSTPLREVAGVRSSPQAIQVCLSG